jgi:molybdate-binding protein/DNA-binding XRE family transcriptional regulator
MSQQDLADAAGVSRQTISGIEAGVNSPSVALALRLARALGCRVEEVFWLEADADHVEATRSPAASWRAEGADQVSLARVGSRWIAYPLGGEQAFRTEMVPADGTVDAGAVETVSVRLLDDRDALERSVALAGCTPALSLWARAAERWHPGLRVHWTFANSTRALESLARGEVHAAGLHLRDPRTGECNTPYVRRLLAGTDVVLVNLGVWEEGLAIAPGATHQVRKVSDLRLPGVRLINREPGSGARQLLDETLDEEQLSPASLAGFDQLASGHLEVARVLQEGRADAGVTTAGVARAFGLGFLPLREVRYDLAVRKEYLDHPPVRQLFATLEHRWVRSQLQVVGGYNTSRTGEVVAEVTAA